MFEVNEKMKIEVITGIKGRSVVVIDDFYKNPDEIRELVLSLEHNDSSELTGGLPGARGVLDTPEVKERLYDVYLTLCANYFGDFDEDKFSKNWDKQIFMSNLLNDDTLREKPLGIIPHQDYYPNQQESSFQFGAVVYLNTDDECAGGTKLYSHFGRISIPEDYQPEWLADREQIENGEGVYPGGLVEPDFEYIKSKIDDTQLGNNPYACEYKAEMKYNRMVLYQADVLHGQDADLGMFTEYNRINQVLFM